MSRVLRDLIRSVVDREPDMKVVGEIDDEPVDIRRLIRARPHVVIVGLDDSVLPTACNQLMRLRPGTKILGVVNDGRLTLLYELQPRSEQLGELSSRVLIDVIRRRKGVA